MIYILYFCDYVGYLSLGVFLYNFITNPLFLIGFLSQSFIHKSGGQAGFHLGLEVEVL